MKRLAPAFAALLLACAPPSDDGAGATEKAAPVERSPGSGQRPAPKPVREKPANKSAKQPLQAGASYYQYVDESGRVRFAASLDEVPERQRSTAGHISVASPTATRRPAASDRDEPAETRTTTNAEVVLYTTESCPYCKKAIAYLDDIGQDYVNKNVETDDQARNEYLELTNGRAGVPVIVVGDKWMQGWSQQRLAKMLSEAH
jgi:glutaredoxin